MASHEPSTKFTHTLGAFYHTPPHHHLPIFNAASLLHSPRHEDLNYHKNPTIQKPKKTMSVTSTTILSLSPHAHLSPPLPPMSILRRLNLHNHLNLRNRNRNHRLFRSLAAAAAVRQDTTVWTQAPLTEIEPAAESLFHVTIDVSDAPDLAVSHTRPGQYLQLRVPDVEKPSFLAIASPPSLSEARGAFEFLVKTVAGSTAELLCGLKKGDVVELSQVMGRGFDIDRVDPPESFPTLLIFATGSGIRSDFCFVYFVF